jgi:membrane protease YdiL (CAAX protease family)
MWAAIAVSALLFGTGHLGAAGALVPLTFAVIVRTVLLNALAGVVFGYLFWRRSLEAAMVAHASAHVAMTLLSLVVAAFRP